MAQNSHYQEGRYIQDLEGKLSAVDSGDPMCLGQIPGVVQKDATASAGTAVLDTQGVYDLSVTAATAIAPGDIVYWHSGTDVLNNTSSGGVRFGYALQAIASGTENIAVKIGY